MDAHPFIDFEKIEGQHLLLRSIQPEDTEALCKALMSPTTWAVTQRGINTEAAFHRYIDSFHSRQRKLEGLTLVACIKETNEVAAFSTFWNLATNLKKVEIGFTWVADRWMRTFVNTEQKFLMLTYAFETLGVKRVEFSVDPQNEKSNAAMKRIGATLEGTLRKWRFLSENDKGDRNLYSLIDDEWPQVKARLKTFLERVNG